MAKLSYEKALKELEDIVREIESGDIPLEKSLKKFEDGVKLSRYCTKMLDEAEQKITILLKDEDGNISEEEMRREQ
ncbi:MAG: exodeoxyribonuclease VII small subunit [Desulfobacteraceae bacterium]|nr:exodeoxyribonuclease VII small subunit [Desulfobacteraceae bacterium]